MLWLGLLCVEQVAWLVVGVRDPDDEVLARADEHTVDVAELDSGDCRRVEVKEADLVPCLNIPNHDLLFRRFTASDQVPRVRAEASLEDGAR